MPSKSSRKPSDQQTKLDFEQIHREQRQLVWAVSYRRAGVTARTWNNIQQVLVFLINVEKGDGIIPYIDTIARACNLSRRTVDRAISEAKRLGILHAEPRKNKRGRASNSWSINFQAIAALGVSNGVNSRQGGVNQRQSGVNSRQSGANPYKEFNYSRTLPEPSTTTSHSVETEARVSVEEEEAIASEVETFKRKCRAHAKVSPQLPTKFDEAVDIAIEKGWTIDDLYKRVQWFADGNFAKWAREHRKGALYHGLTDPPPGTPVNQGWPYR